MCPFEPDFAAGQGRGNGVRYKVIRILRMARMLDRARPTVDELAERFGVSRRTVYRDLKLIAEALAPLTERPATGERRPVVGTTELTDAPPLRPYM